jgi:hypothetical protein
MSVWLSEWAVSWLWLTVFGIIGLTFVTGLAVVVMAIGKSIDQKYPE